MLFFRSKKDVGSRESKKGLKIDIDQDIINLNQISKFKIIKPNYPQYLNKERVIQFVFLPDEKVLLLGSMDSQYPYWVSITDIKDIKTNTAISNYILFNNFSNFTSINCTDLYTLIKHRYTKSFYIKNNSIETPLGYDFSSEPSQIKYWGKMTAEGISHYYDNLKELCKFRECDGKYLNILKDYLKILENKPSDDDILNYTRNLNLIKLIQSENYLLLSDDEAIRETYIKTTKIISDLYNGYMTIVR